MFTTFINYVFTLEPLSLHSSMIHLFHSDDHTWIIISLCEHHVLHNQGPVPLRNSLQQINHSTIDFQFTYFFSFNTHVIRSMGVGEPLTCHWQYIFILFFSFDELSNFLCRFFFTQQHPRSICMMKKSRKMTAPRFPSCISNNSTRFSSQYSTKAQIF